MGKTEQSRQTPTETVPHPFSSTQSVFLLWGPVLMQPEG